MRFIFLRQIDLVQFKHLKVNVGLDLPRLVLIDGFQQLFEVCLCLVGFLLDLNLRLR